MLWWLLQNLFVAATLAGVVFAVCRLCRISPAGRHILWTIVLVKLVTPPLVFWPWPVPEWGGESAIDVDPQESREVAAASPSPPASFTAAQQTTNAPPDSAVVHSETFVAIRKTPLQENDSAKPAFRRVPADTPVPVRVETAESAVPSWWSRLPWTMLAGGIWIAGSLLVLLRNLLRILSMNRLARLSETADDALQRQVATWAERLGIRPPVVRVSDRIASPLIWAAGRPLLLWPAKFAADIESNTWQCVLVHELAHVKRRDHWVGRLELFAACVWWWNPLFWYVRDQVRENSELACDAWVVGTIPDGRRAYAEALLLVCESMSQPSVPIPVFGVGSGSRRHLERRLTMILKEKVPFRASWSVVLAVVVLGFVTLPAWTQSKNELPVPRYDQFTPSPPKPERPRANPKPVPKRGSVDTDAPDASTKKPRPSKRKRFDEKELPKSHSRIVAPNRKPTLSSDEESNGGGLDPSIKPATVEQAGRSPKSSTTSDLQRQIMSLKQELNALRSLNHALVERARAARVRNVEPADERKIVPARTAHPVVGSPFQTEPIVAKMASDNPDRVVATHTITLQRTTYRLPANRAKALQTFLQQHLKAEVLSIELGRITVRNPRTIRHTDKHPSVRTVYEASYQPVVVITTTPDIQKTIGQLIAAMRKDAPETGDADDSSHVPAASIESPQPAVQSKSRELIPGTSKLKSTGRFSDFESPKRPKPNRFVKPQPSVQKN